MKGAEIMMEIANEVGKISDVESADLVAIAAEIRQRIIDRWYRFADLGVTSRAELEPIKVMIRRTFVTPSEMMLAWFDPKPSWQLAMTIDATGTPLEDLP